MCRKLNCITPFIVPFRFRFLHTIDPAVAEEFKVPAETVSVYVPEIYHSPYENSTFHLSKKSATYKEILQFIKKNSVPLVSQRTKHNNFKFTERPMIVVYFDVNYDYQYVKDTQYVRKMILQVLILNRTKVFTRISAIRFDCKTGFFGHSEKKLKAKKTSKLKEKTQNSSLKPKKSALFKNFWTFFCKKFTSFMRKT